MNNAIQLDRLSKRFKATEALKGVTLDVPEGSVFAILGENGAGKTTAIKIMLGLSHKYRVLGYSKMLAWEAELHWTLRCVTARIDIPNERLHDCVDFLRAWPKTRSRHADWLAVAYQRDLIWLQHGPVDKQYSDHRFHDEPLPWRYRWFSFERERMLKLLNRAFLIAAERAEEYETAVSIDRAGVLPHDVDLVTAHDIVPYEPARPIWTQIAKTSSGIDPAFYLFDPVEWSAWNSSPNPFYVAEAQRRGTILYLALQMYYNDHGRLPESLEGLVDGEYLDRLPVVPVACQPFYYAPRGADEVLLAAIKSVNAPENLWNGLAQRSASAFFEHDFPAPFLWHPFQPGGQMDPCTGPGWFIDLDFVEQPDPLPMDER